MIGQINSTQNFNGRLLIVDKYGKIANYGIQKEVLAQLGNTAPKLKSLIAPKHFDLFISKGSTDYLSINANNSYIGVLRGDINFYSLHKSILDKIVQVARTSIQEYEKFIQKNV